MALVKLKQFRTEYEFTCQEVADNVGVSKEYYWMIENGKRRLNYDLAVRIAKVFDVKPDDIFLNDELTTSKQNNKAI